MSITTWVDENKITLKNDNSDSYTLNEILFKAIGSKVPEEIKQAFNMADVNFQDQGTYWFLLNETSGNS